MRAILLLRVSILLPLSIATISACSSAPAFAAPDAPAEATRTLTQRIAGMDHKDGLFPLDWDANSGKLYLELPEVDKDFLLLDHLAHGMGSNDVGLDRGQLGEGRVVHFSRYGNKVLLIAPNLNFRSSSSDLPERTAVTESFAESVLWGFKVDAEENGRLLVDATDFFLRDSHGVAERMLAAGQGIYKLDANRSAITLENTKNFPKNTEVEAILTFASDGTPKAPFVAAVTPDAHSMSVREHTSFIALPEPGFKPRVFDPRSGFYPFTYRDYSVPLDQRMDQKFIIRHRLEKKDPTAAVSEPVKPILYYVDRGAPEPIRSALVEGANWWAAAYEAAGFKNAFHVEVLPEGADPMDIRYNMIQWVHRATRGWSYGEAILDPRTGEIIKGQVTLGSLRARQDWTIAEALLAPYVEGKPIPPDLEQMVLARTRQLAAHEVGHTLGLQHNFAASSVAFGESVMDYPHPFVALDASGKPNLDKAYAIGVGAWDKAAIRYGYSQFAPGKPEQPELEAMLEKNQKDGLRYITDEDSRPLGSAHPYAHLWDNGPDATAELDRILTVRAAALKRFGVDNIRVGEPMAQLEDTLVPLYLLHRYQTEATAKLVGGLDYTYAVRGPDAAATGMVTAPISAERQHAALHALLKTLDPQTLTLPESLLAQLPPRPPGYPRTRESFAGHTGLTFDAQGPVESAATLTASLLFEPTRASRLVENHAADTKLPGLEEVLDQVFQATWKAPRQTGSAAETQLTVEDVLLTSLLQLATAREASTEARAEALAEIASLETWLKNQKETAGQAHRMAALATIERFRREPERFTAPPPLPTPPGQPIGSGSEDEDPDFAIQ